MEPNAENNQGLKDLRKNWDLSNDKKWKETLEDSGVTQTEVENITKGLESKEINYYKNPSRSIGEFLEDAEQEGKLNIPPKEIPTTKKANKILGISEQDAQNPKKDKNHILKKVKAMRKTLSSMVTKACNKISHTPHSKTKGKDGREGETKSLTTKFTH